MNSEQKEKCSLLLQTLGLAEPPMGIFYSDEKPADGFFPKAMDLPTRKKEQKNEIDWQDVFCRFSCVMGNIWRARKKGKPAFFDKNHFGCPGGAFWFGFLKPQTETVIHYVSSGIPGHLNGELYCESPDELRRIFDDIDPRPAPKTYCVVKPLSLFEENQEPELVSFFVRPEPLCGLHQLAAFVTNDPEVVVSPWGAACGNLVTWPLKYKEKGMNKAVLGGWDPSARKFYKTDELSFTIPFEMFDRMLNRFENSFLKTKTWKTVRKKISRSNKVWREN
jgi:uncharacterized protein (DUF169 family)